jgi:tetratricopeptide (TPR) repeat protein
MAQALLALGDVNQALQTQGEALQILVELARANPTNATLREYLAEAQNFLGELLEHKGDADRALESHRRAYAMFAELVSADPTNYLAKTNFAFSGQSIGKIMVKRGDAAGGLKTLQEARTAYEAMAAGGAQSRYIHSGLAQCYFEMGLAYSSEATSTSIPSALRAERWREARSSFQQSLKIWTEMRGDGSLETSERDMPERAAREIAKCDHALGVRGAGGE